MEFAEAAAIEMANGSVGALVAPVLDSNGESVAARHGGRSFEAGDAASKPQHVVARGHRM